MRKIINTICLILWSICFCIDVVNVVRGTPVNAITAALPALVCIMLYAEKLFME